MSDSLNLPRADQELPATETPRAAVHFGVNVRSGAKYGLRITRDTYAQINKRSSIDIRRELNLALWESVADRFEDEDHRILTDAWCIEHQARALQNYDLNMAFFASLDRAEFDQAVLEAVTSQRGMVEVNNLSEWERPGLYVMVLDDFRQAYVGIASGNRGIAQRIRQHWSANKAFDRLLWGGVNDSILSIDSFRALDTTRIFAAKAPNPTRLESKMIESFPAKFLLNRVRGGDGRALSFASRLGIDIMKRRDLSGLDLTNTDPLA